jgi:hypothetical protein
MWYNCFDRTLTITYLAGTLIPLASPATHHIAHEQSSRTRARVRQLDRGLASGPFSQGRYV